MEKEVITTTRELAKILNVTEVTIFRWRQKGMPYIEMNNGRKGYIIADVKTWLYGK